MYWEEDVATPLSEQEIVTDISFSIKCRSVPLDHAAALRQTLVDALPWLQDEPLAGIHNIHIQAEANGWFRPDDAQNDEILLSKRSKLRIRVPIERLEDATQLPGKTLNIAGHKLEITKFIKHPIQDHSTLFARHILLKDNENEQSLVKRIIPFLEEQIECRIKKVLCGKTNRINTPQGILNTQSLMIADLKKQESKKLQEIGMSTGEALLGCGLFIPHKGIAAVNETS